MKLIRHPVAGLILFSVLILLLINVYNGLESSYGIVRVVEDLESGNTESIAQRLSEIPISDGINTINEGILKLKPGAGTSIDILGGITSVGLGALKTVFGLTVLPYSISSIVLDHYGSAIPGEIGGLIAMIIVYVGFILLSAYLGRGV